MAVREKKLNQKQPLARSEIMRRVRSKNSAAECALRSALHVEGLRFRLHRCLAMA